MTLQKPNIRTEDPLEQVLSVARELKAICADEPRRLAMIEWFNDFVNQMPSMSFAHPKYTARDVEGRVWASLGSIIYYLYNPEDHVFHHYCAEAISCYEKAFNCDPSDSIWKGFLSDIKNGKRST